MNAFLQSIDTKMRSFTTRIPNFLKQIIRAEAEKRTTALNPIPSEAGIIREALKEWAQKRGLWPAGLD